MYCVWCGKFYYTLSPFCPYCGHDNSDSLFEEEDSSAESKAGEDPCAHDNEDGDSFGR